MNIAFVFFITIGLLIIILSIFDVSMNAMPIHSNINIEGYTDIILDEWDIDGLKSTLDSLKASGIDYSVTNFTDHISMIVNYFNALVVTTKSGGGEFDINTGKCYWDDGARFLKTRGPDTYDYTTRQGWQYGKPLFDYAGENKPGENKPGNNPGSFRLCKDFANAKNMNTFGVEYGGECWVGNTDDNMVTTEGRKLVPLNWYECNRGWPMDSQTGSGWTMQVFKKEKIDKKTISNYADIIKKFVNNKCYNDSDVIMANNLNMSGTNGFTTMEGFVEGATTVASTTTPPYGGISPNSLFVSNDDKIKITNNAGQQVDIVTNKIIDAIVLNNYKISRNDLGSFMYRFISVGKTVDDINTYIKKNLEFGIDSDFLYNIMIKRLIEISPNPDQYKDQEKLFENLRFFGVTNANGIVYLSRGQYADGWFVYTIKVRGLSNYKLQLLPSTLPGNGPESILSKLQPIDGIIKTSKMTVTVYGWNVYSFPYLLYIFSHYNVNGLTFFNEIYPIYSDQTLQIYNYSPINPKSDPLIDALYKINSFSSSGLVDSFKRLKEFLGQNGLNMTFNDYVRFVDALRVRVKYNCSIIELWIRFKTYYSTVAFPNAFTSKILPSNLIDMIDQIKSKSGNDRYFIEDYADFYKYLQILIDKKYQLSRVLDDVSLGKTYNEFLENYKTSITIPSQNFTTINKQEPDFLQYLTDGFNSLFGIKSEFEGLETNTRTIDMEADIIVLSKFGITDYNVQLKTVEDLLLQYNIQEINPSNTRWRNIINIIDKLTKVSINLNNLKKFITAMVDFKADTIQKWYNVLEQLSLVQIKGFENIEGFIILMIRFGVSYSNNFFHFINILIEFKADISISLDTVRVFLDDMMYVGYKYNTHRKEVDDLVRYFIKCKYVLTTYSVFNNAQFSKELCTADTNVLPIAGLPRIIVRSFYDYKSANANISNNLYDIRNASLLNDIPYCDVIESMQQVLLIVMPNLRPDTNRYKDAIPRFVPNISLVIAFLYKEEFDQIINNTDAYADYAKRVALVRDMATGIIAYKDSLKNKEEYKESFELYTSLAKTLNTFPVLCFQYIANYITSSCNNVNCEYSKFVNPELSFSKARNDGKMTNYRFKEPPKPSGPIV